jgi:hypothetical protein
VAAVHAALGANSPKSIALAAVGLKNLLEIFGDKQADALVKELEDKGNSKNISGADQILRSLEQTIQAMTQELKQNAQRKAS